MSNFEATATITDAVLRALNVLAQYKRGETVTWDALEQAAGFARYTQHWSSFWNRLKRDFMNQAGGVCLWPETNVGARLLTAQEQLTERAVKRRRRALRQMRKDQQELAAVPDRELTMNQRVLKSQQLQAARDGSKQVLRQLRVSHVLAKPSAALPRAPIPMKQSA